MGAAGQYTIDQAIAISRPAASVYALLADIQDAVSAHVVMVKEPAAPTHVGTCWHERVRLAPGFWLRVESVVTVAQAPRRLAMDFTSRCWTGQLTYQIEDTADGCVLRHREVLRPRGPLRPVTQLIGRRLDSKIEERLADIRDIVEGRAAR